MKFLRDEFSQMIGLRKAPGSPYFCGFQAEIRDDDDVI